MTIMTSADRFPSRSSLVRGCWAPILFSPNPDSPERLVLAIAAVGESGFYVAAADSAKRLACLYGASAATALMVQETTIDALNDDLAARGRDALEKPQTFFSGISIGRIREGEARTIEDLAIAWLRSTSSLHYSKQSKVIAADEAADEVVAAIQARADNDRLPVLVYKEVEKGQPTLGNFFSADIRYRARKTVKPKPQTVLIGFAGSRVVANFATLKTERPRPLIDHIKRLMWDLARHRDTDFRHLDQRDHQMIVFRRGVEDPEFDERKARELDEMVNELGEQGEKDDIRVEARASVGAIASHIVNLEARSMH